MAYDGDYRWGLEHNSFEVQRSMQECLQDAGQNMGWCIQAYIVFKISGVCVVHDFLQVRAERVEFVLFIVNRSSLGTES